MKQLFALCITASLSVIPCVKAKAAVPLEIKEESQTEIQERVFEEIRTGEITNDADAIKVALKQYQERKNQAAKISEPGQEEVVDDTLSITQVTGRQMDENGNIKENMLSTNLIVLDENDNIMKASEIYSFDTNQYGELSAYSIYATMTVSVTMNISSSYDKMRFDYVDTTLYYGTAMKATKLEQSSTYAPDTFFVYSDGIKQTTNPQANVKYRYIPSNQEFITFMRRHTGRTCESHIYVGSHSLGLGYSFTCETQNDGRGTWEVKVN
ncbi:MAG: hypothetical protein HFH34_14355 [Eubacterium sp.]|nr:hypothetical protein [Eubacterium sp.]